MDPIERLNSLGQFRMRLDLSRMKTAISWLDHPQSSIPSIHVAGTNGKGSTCHMVESIASVFPVNTSLYTSPHLMDITERICINGEQIEFEILLNELEYLFALSDEVFEEDNNPTYFEMLTLAFFHMAHENDSDLNIVEVGMGGRFDATNILDPQAVAITSISMDHEFHLGSDEVEIAREKAGIIKMSTPVVLGPVHRSAPNGWKVLCAILDVCSSLGCPVLIVCNNEEMDRVKEEMRERGIPDGRCIIVSGSSGSKSIDIVTIPIVKDSTFSDRLGILDDVLSGEFPVPLSGSGQDSNTAIALCLALLSLPAAFAHQKLRSGDRKGLSDLVKDRPDLFHDSYTSGHLKDLLRNGSMKTNIMGRMEILSSGDPLLIFDGGHNQEASMSIADSLENEFSMQSVPILLAMMEDKDPVMYIRKMRDIAGPIVVTELDERRSVKASELALSLSGILESDIHVRADIEDACRTWLELSKDHGYGFAGGSFYLYKPLIEFLNRPI